MNVEEHVKAAEKVQKALNRLFQSDKKMPVSAIAQLIDGVMGQMMENQNSIINKISEIDPDCAVATVNFVTGSIVFSLLASVECKSKKEIEELMQEFELTEQATIKYGSYIPDDIEKAGKA